MYITAAVKAAKTGVWKDGFKNFGKSLGLGLTGAAVGHVVEEGTNWVERRIEKEAGNKMKEINDSDDIDIASNANYMGIIGKLFFPVFLPCIFIIGIPIEIRNYIIKRIVDKEYPLKTEK